MAAIAEAGIGGVPSTRALAGAEVMLASAVARVAEAVGVPVDLADARPTTHSRATEVAAGVTSTTAEGVDAGVTGTPAQTGTTTMTEPAAGAVVMVTVAAVRG